MIIFSIVQTFKQGGYSHFQRIEIIAHSLPDFRYLDAVILMDQHIPKACVGSPINVRMLRGQRRIEPFDCFTNHLKATNNSLLCSIIRQKGRFTCSCESLYLLDAMQDIMTILAL